MINYRWECDIVSKIEKMIDAGLLIADDPDMLALAFTSPITTLIHYCDREPEKEPEIMRQIEAFVKHFIKMYGKTAFDKLHGIHKLMMKMMKSTVGKGLADKQDRTPEEDAMLDLLLHGGNLVSSDNLNKLLAWYGEQ